MKKLPIYGIASICMILLLAAAGCAKAAPLPDYAGTAQEYAPPEYRLWSNDMTLTSEQALEDFDYMWTVLEQNASFLKLIDDYSEHTGESRASLEARMTQAREKLSRGGKYSLDELYAILSESFGYIAGYGHLSVITPELYPYLCETFRSIAEGEAADGYVNDAFKSFIRRYVELVDNRKSREAYAALADMSGAAGGGESGGFAESDPDSRIVISEESGIPYIGIDTFAFTEGEATERAIEILNAFCADNATAENIIIDIRGNGGGSDIIWLRGFVEPLLSATVQNDHCQATLMGPLTMYLRQYSDGDFENSADVESVDEKTAALLPYAANGYSEYGKSDGYVGFKGRIWLLVDGYVGSSADSFASFCRGTDFARIVGARTKNGGLSSQPIAFPLPNSGLCIFFEDIVGLNVDGTCNAYLGTPPNITVSDDALATCVEILTGKK